MKKFRYQLRKGERGNVLFLILIAVALFAALSYAVTQSTRSGGGDAGRETSKISSAEMTQYPAGIRTSLVRMIIGGQNVETLEFNAPEEFGTDGTDGCTEYPDGTLKFPRCVFHPTGGGATYARPSNDLVAGPPNSWFFNAENEIHLVGTSNPAADNTVSAATADLIAFLPNVTEGVCQSINEELGIPINPIPTESGILFSSFGGGTGGNMVNLGNDPTAICDTSCDGGVIGDATVSTHPLNGQPFGCFYVDGSSAKNSVDDSGAAEGYVYYHVLIER